MGVSVRKRENRSGWWVFIRHAEERTAFRYNSEDEAQDVAKAFRQEIALGRLDLTAIRVQAAREEKQFQEAVPTLKEFFDQTMAPLWEASLARKSYVRYEGAFRLYIDPALGALPVNEITRDRVKSFVVSLLPREIGEGDKKRRLSKDSIRNIVATLRSALSEAVEKGLLAANPAVRLGKLYRQAGALREEVEPFTADEIPILLEATREHFGLDNYVVTLAAFHLGLRAAELAGLKWMDLDIQKRAFRVRRQYRDGVESRTKGKKNRTVDVSDALLSELQALKKRRQEEYLGRGKNEVPEWIFLGPGRRLPEGKRAEGRPLDMDHFRNRVFWKACDKAKIRRRPLHSTRHSFASILLMAGESPQYVKEQLGHSSIRLTVDTYGHFIPGSNRQAVNKLPSIAGPTGPSDHAASGN